MQPGQLDSGSHTTRNSPDISCRELRGIKLILPGSRRAHVYVGAA